MGLVLIKKLRKSSVTILFIKLNNDKFGRERMFQNFCRCLYFVLCGDDVVIIIIS